MKEWLAIAGWLIAASALLLFYAQLLHAVRRRNRIAYPYLVLGFIAGIGLAAVGRSAPAFLVLALGAAMALGVLLVIFGAGRRAR